jgi:C4-dicarboxylate-specific signal transduction histidine kinase
MIGLESLDRQPPLHILDFIALHDRDRMGNEAIPAMVNEGRWIGETALLQFATGDAIPVLLDCFRIDDPSTGQPVNFAGVAHDLRPQKQIERRLQDEAASSAREAHETALELDDAKARLEEVRLELYHAARLSVAGQMSAVIAHELSQPLTATITAASAARRLSLGKNHSTDELRELVENVVIQAERAGTILRRLRQFVRPVASARRQPENLRQLIADAVGFAFVGPDAVDVALELYFDPDTPTVMVDRIQVQQIVANLIRNALDALRANDVRTIRLSTARCDSAMVEVIVSDSGPGVSDAMSANLFKPLQTTKQNGMGLGLSICRTIVEAHGGNIRHEARQQGGAVFRFTLPASTTSGEG